MTVKTQDGKVITKGGKVSCGCCDIGCFFYPAVGIREGLYTAEDLPDFIYTEFEELYLHQKIGDEYYSVNQIGNLPPGKSRVIILNLGGTVWTPGNPDFDLQWAWQRFENGQWIYALSPGDESTMESLFSFANIWGTVDLFADTYTVTGIFNGQSDSRIVTRIPPLFPGYPKSCIWQGDGVRLRYNGGFTGIDFQPQYTFQGNFKWQVNGNNKSGFQNTPVGSYAGGYSVS